MNLVNEARFMALTGGRQAQSSAQGAAGLDVEERGQGDDGRCERKFATTGHRREEEKML